MTSVGRSHDVTWSTALNNFHRIETRAISFYANVFNCSTALDLLTATIGQTVAHLFTIVQVPMSVTMHALATPVVCKTNDSVQTATCDWHLTNNHKECTYWGMSISPPATTRPLTELISDQSKAMYWQIQEESYGFMAISWYVTSSNIVSSIRGTNKFYNF